MAKRSRRENEPLEELADIIGADLLAEVCRELGGLSIYLPREPQRFKRNMRIKSRFGRLLETTYPLNMRSIFAQLSREFSLSEAQLRRIIRE